MSAENAAAEGLAPVPTAIASPAPLPSLVFEPAGGHSLDLEVRDNFKLRFLIPRDSAGEAFAATSGVWKPLESVALSAGYGVAEPAIRVLLRGCEDPLACLRANDQRPVTIETYSLGASWRVNDNFSVTMDYLNRHSGAAETIPTTLWLGSDLGSFGRYGSTLNLGDAEALDLSLTCDIDAGAWGDLELGLQVSRVINQRIEFRGQASDAPLTSAAFGLGWQRGPFRGDLTSRYLDVTSRPDDAMGWTSLDVNFAWRMPWNASVSVGARNVLNNPAPATNNLSDAEMENFFGRVPYVRYQQDL